MNTDPKQHFVSELVRHLRDRVAETRRVEATAAEAAEGARSDARTREDAKAATSESRMATAHAQRRQQAEDELDTLVALVDAGLRRFTQSSAVDVGAMVDVAIEDEDTGDEEQRTLLMLPVGAGIELAGPGGDGFVSVITPRSPVGRALLGARIGSTVAVTTPSGTREWTVLDLM